VKEKCIAEIFFYQKQAINNQQSKGGINIAIINYNSLKFSKEYPDTNKKIIVL